MGHWQNSRWAKELRHTREAHFAAGRRPIVVGVARGDAQVPAAVLCQALNRLLERRWVTEVHAAGLRTGWPGLTDWASVVGVSVGYRSDRQLIYGGVVHGIVAFGLPDDYLAAARARRVPVWVPCEAPTSPQARV